MITFSHFCLVRFAFFIAPVLLLFHAHTNTKHENRFVYLSIFTNLFPKKVYKISKIDRKKIHVCTRAYNEKVKWFRKVRKPMQFCVQIYCFIYVIVMLSISMNLSRVSLKVPTQQMAMKWHDMVYFHCLCV